VLADFASCFALGALLEEAAQQTQRLGGTTASTPVRCAHSSVFWYPWYQLCPILFHHTALHPEIV
jgi:hypothetical protein